MDANRPEGTAPGNVFRGPRTLPHEHRLLPETAKCTRCRKRAVIALPSHHANFCEECFVLFFRRAVLRAMKHFPIRADEPILVAVSGGKDSLAAWAVLQDLGYRTRGVHLNLGIPAFSDASQDAIAAFAEARNLPWVSYSLRDLLGFSIPEIRRRIRRPICSVCGMIKRRLLNRLTIREGLRVIATGHNLDDEAGRLLGNLVRNRREYIEKQSPYLPSVHPKLPEKIKPLYRVSADEIRTYCRVEGIAYVEGACPLSRGATSHMFKEALDMLEGKMPGTKRDFLFAYLDARSAPKVVDDFGTCDRCGEPCYGTRCSVCALLERLREPHPDRGGP
ncbi:MAG: ATP-binding protein [Desulfosoma sp.]